MAELLKCVGQYRATIPVSQGLIGHLSYLFMPESVEIGTRFEEWGKRQFGGERGWLKKCADSLGLDSSSLKKYLKGQVVPASRMQEKLRALGCDIEWLMTGREAKEDIGSHEVGTVGVAYSAEPGADIPAAEDMGRFMATYLRLSANERDTIKKLVEALAAKRK